MNTKSSMFMSGGATSENSWLKYKFILPWKSQIFCFFYALKM